MSQEVSNFQIYKLVSDGQKETQTGINGIRDRLTRLEARVDGIEKKTHRTNGSPLKNLGLKEWLLIGTVGGGSVGGAGVYMTKSDKDLTEVKKMVEFLQSAHAMKLIKEVKK